jgi:hypothetical protein
MGIIITNPEQTAINRVAVSEQNKIIKWVIDKIEESDIFENYEINFNDLKIDKSNVGIILNSGARKSSEYVDGGYDAVIPLNITLRKVGTESDDSRLHNIDLINQLGIWFDENIVRNKEVEGYTIYSVEQQNQATLVYADESGIEDTSAEFRVSYSKD